MDQGEIRIETDVAHRAYGDHARRPCRPYRMRHRPKQLYSSHYFQTALDLSVCVRESTDPKRPGFYLIKALG